MGEQQAASVNLAWDMQPPATHQAMPTSRGETLFRVGGPSVELKWKGLEETRESSRARCSSSMQPPWQLVAVIDRIPLSRRGV